VDWIGFTNPGRTRLRASLGVLDWLVPPMPHRSLSARIGEVKQLHEELYPETAEEREEDRDLIYQHAEEACDCINLGRFSKLQMPNEVMQNLICIMSETGPPMHYSDENQSLVSPNQDGKAVSYFLRLWEFRNPTYEYEGCLHGEAKCDVLKVLTTNKYNDLDLQGQWWIPW
jgi:hypothetical protein